MNEMAFNPEPQGPRMGHDSRSEADRLADPRVRIGFDFTDGRDD